MLAGHMVLTIATVTTYLYSNHRPRTPFKIVVTTVLQGPFLRLRPGRNPVFQLVLKQHVSLPPYFRNLAIACDRQ